MQHSELMVTPMRRDLSRHGVLELRTVADVDEFMDQAGSGTALLIVNSVCGCSAGSMRPAVGLALSSSVRPTRAASVFAGQDVEATARAREFLAPHPPSSPAVALFRDGELVFLMPRNEIQGRAPEALAARLADMLRTHCSPDD
jgi:putative YphP/YqiW family bacilliredoxin